MSEFRLEQKYRAEAGAPNGALVFRIHHLSGAALSPARLCYSCMTRPSRDYRVEGGTLVRHFANHVEILPPEGLTLRPGDVWQVEIHGLSHKPVNRTQGAMAAWFETDDGPLTIATGDLQPPEGEERGTPKVWPEGKITLPIGLLPWPASVEIPSYGSAPQLYPASAGLKPEMARVAALHRRLFPAAPGPFSLDADVSGRAVEAVAAELPAGGFRVDFGETITIEQGDADGLRHGLIALAQMAHAERTDRRFRFPLNGTIEDAPRHGWRGLMLDVSRNFIDHNGVRRVLDTMAWQRMNRLHWHLCDDEGWRVPIAGLSQLTKAWSTRARGHVLPPQYADGPDGQAGAYSIAEIRALVAHAKALGIEIMPEVDMPGHMAVLLAVMPELVDPEETPDSYRSVQGYPNNALNPGVEAVWPVVETILDGLADLFPFDVVHLGGDEVDALSWSQSPAAQALVEREGLAPGAAPLQSYFLRRVQQMLRARGRRMAGWDECADGGGVEPDALLFAWRSQERVATLIADGYEVVGTPGQAYYLDMIETAGWDAPGTFWAGVSTPENSYAYEATDGLPEGPGKLAGIQGCMWTEQIDSVARFNDIAFPRWSVVAEAGWSTEAAKDWQRFAALSRLMPQM